MNRDSGRRNLDELEGLEEYQRWRKEWDRLSTPEKLGLFWDWCTERERLPRRRTRDGSKTTLDGKPLTDEDMKEDTLEHFRENIRDDPKNKHEWAQEWLDNKFATAAPWVGPGGWRTKQQGTRSSTDDPEPLTWQGLMDYRPWFVAESKETWPITTSQPLPPNVGDAVKELLCLMGVLVDGGGAAGGGCPEAKSIEKVKVEPKREKDT